MVIYIHFTPLKIEYLSYVSTIISNYMAKEAERLVFSCKEGNLSWGDWDLQMWWFILEKLGEGQEENGPGSFVITVSK